LASRTNEGDSEGKKPHTAMDLAGNQHEDPKKAAAREAAKLD
jgi:hypothetical protein